MSAGRMYDKLGKKAKGKIVFVIPGGAICKITISFGNWFTMARYFLSRNAWHELKHPYRVQNQELLALWTKVRNMEEDIW